MVDRDLNPAVSSQPERARCYYPAMDALVTALVPVMMVCAAVGAALSVILRLGHPGQIRTVSSMWNTAVGRWSILLLFAAAALGLFLIFGPAKMQHVNVYMIGSLIVGALAGFAIAAIRRRR